MKNYLIIAVIPALLCASCRGEHVNYRLPAVGLEFSSLKSGGEITRIPDAVSASVSDAFNKDLDLGEKYDDGDRLAHYAEIKYGASGYLLKIYTNDQRQVKFFTISHGKELLVKPLRAVASINVLSLVEP